MKRHRRWFLVPLTAAALAAAGLQFPEFVGRVAYAVDTAKASVATEKLATAQDLSAAFRDVAVAIRPSVVNISSVEKAEVSPLRRSPLSRSPFRDFFDDDTLERFFSPEAPRQDRRGLGSGVIVSEDGYILTNNHVVADADEIRVNLSDDRSFRAKLIGTDPQTDLAIVKIDAKGLHPADLGDSDQLQVGDWVIASGSPFGLSHTITAGIVSAKGRSNMGLVDYEDFIQTDAAINPGNSGGPLVNLKGEVVGINSAIFSRSGGFMGIGFSIPINMAKEIMASLMESGKVVRGWLGVAIQNLNEELAKSFGYDGTEGALIGDVTDGGPASKAGLKSGDIIVQFNGKKVEDVNHLRSQVAATEPGSTVKVEVFRDGEHKTLKVKILERQTQVVSAASGGQSSVEDLGMTVRSLDSQTAQELDAEDAEGVVVTNVDPLGPADRAGIRANDLIVSVQGHDVASLSAFRRQISDADLSKGVRMTVLSGKMKRFVFLQSE